MPKIRRLSDDLAHKIAAGEVVERPASVVKELVENSVDAFASRVEVEIRDGGKEYIRVSDDGDGISSGDLLLAFQRHATSKLEDVDGLFAIRSLGFRGEALPSIASVSRLLIRTRAADESAGSQLIDPLRDDAEVEPTALPIGTVVEVRDLFFNTPARFKFLKTSGTERRYIVEYLTDMALAHPDMAFHLRADGRDVLRTTGSGSLESAAVEVFGQSTAQHLVAFAKETEWGSVSGLLGKPAAAKKNRSGETVIVNGRVVTSYRLANAAERAYQGLLGHREFPTAVVVIDIEPTLIDVNVHPAKIEVRFQHEQAVCQDVFAAVRQGILGADLSVSLDTHSSGAPSKEKTLSLSRKRPVSRQENLSIPSPQGKWDPASWDQVDAVLQENAMTRAVVSESKADENPRDVQLNESRRDDDEGEIGDARHWLRAGRIIGQLHQTYILLEVSAGLWLLDQHIIHERVLYERFVDKDYHPASQMIVPETLEWSAAQAEIIAEHLEELVAMGFVLEPFGQRAFVLRGVPNELKQCGGWQRQIADLAEDCKEQNDWRHPAALTMACSGSVKAGQYLDNREIRELLQLLAGTENPFTCPHGRPIIVRLEREELLRRFGRPVS